MGKTAILSLRIIGDAKSAVGALGETDDAAGRMSRGMDRAAGASTVALGAIAGMAVVAGNAASEAEQAVGGVDAVFGQYAERMKQYAADAAQTVGLSSTEYNTLATVLGSQLKNMGLSLDETTAKTQDLVGMGADLAAQYGGTTSEAVSALSSLLRGERDPIERYGVSMNQAAVDAEKAALGLTGLTGEADKAATLQATLSILTRQTADASGAFAREADTAAGAQQRANAEWANAVAELGTALLPVMSEAAGLLASVASFVAENSEGITILVGVVALLAAGIIVVNGAMKAYAAVQAIATAATWASNAAWLANPLTYVVLLVVALIAVIVLLVAHWDEVRAGAAEAFEPLGRYVDGAVLSVKMLWQWIKDLGSAIKNVFNGGGLGQLWDQIKSFPGLRMAVTPEIDQAAPTMRMARMATMAAPEASSSSRLMAAPSAGAVAALSPSSRASDARPTNVNVNLTFTGLVSDPVAVGREVQSVLREYASATGAKVAGA